jgi:hypothetical protein
MHMRDFIASMREQLARWRSELANIEPPTNAGEQAAAEALRAFIAEGDKIVADSGY